jgi:putative endonuclease
MSLIQYLHLHVIERALVSLRRTAVKRGRVALQPPHLEMGRRGEEAALFHLRREGYVVVARRWKHVKQRGDLDLIAWEGDTLCFVEVKTRGGREVATAESAVDEEKRQVLRRLARVYLKMIEPAPSGARFDVISIYFDGGQQEQMLFRGAFGW